VDAFLGQREVPRALANDLRSFLCLAQTPSVGRETIDNFSQASPVPSRLMTKKATIGKAHDTHISRDDGVETATVLEY
jgi:hypothetical protein